MRPLHQYVSILSSCTEPNKFTTLRMGLARAPINLDPRHATDAASSRISRLIYRRLVEFDNTNRPIPGLATWTQPSPTQYHFRLLDEPKGRTFSNGHILTAQDVKATLDSILDPNVGSPYRSQIKNIQQIQAIGNEEVVIDLKQPDALFPTRLVLAILPANLIATGHKFNQHPIGSGSFKLLAWPQPGHLKLQRLADKQLLEFIEVKDPSVRVMKLLRGEINILQNELSPELFRYLKTKNQVTTQERPGINFTYIGLHSKDPALSKLEVRRAIAHAIDRKAIIRHLFGGTARLAASMLPAQHWAGAKDLDPIPYNPILARKLLAQAGYTKANPLTLSHKTTTDPFRLRIATTMQAQLKAVGIQVKIQSLDWGTFYGDIKSGRFQIYTLIWVGIKTPDHFRAVVHSEAVPPKGANRGHYHNPQVDSLLDQVAKKPDIDSQIPIYHTLQRILLQDLPYIPLWYENQIAVTKNNIRGYAPAEDGNFDALNHTYIDYEINDNDSY
ncbi:hypothetical protein TI05_02155 [Achromatium sp. WMS3]|nr:hypothetical protein TI05_02155 [Achromatium sp. WMS3]